MFDLPGYNSEKQGSDADTVIIENKITGIIFGVWKEETENTPCPLVLAGGFRDKREVYVGGILPDV